MDAKRLKEINDRKLEIRAALEGTEQVDLDAFKNELEALEKEANEIRSRKEVAEQINIDNIETNEIQTNNVEVRDTMKHGLDSLEYRKAYMDYVQAGMNPEAMAEEFRTEAFSVTGENTAVIPATTINSIMEKMEKYGELYSLVRKVHYPSGVNFPTSTLAGSADWMTEGQAVDVNKKATSLISFSANQLGCALGLTFLAQVRTIEAFENSLAENIARNMVKKVDAAIVNGTGTGQPTGILKATPHASQSLALSYKGIINILKKQDPAYTNNVLVVNDSTFYDLVGITDDKGQPVARVNFGVTNGFDKELFGKRIVTSSQLPSLDAASAGDVVGFLFNLDDYVLNVSHDIDLVTYIDNPTRNKVYQSIGVFDGKVLDNNSLVTITKA